ncbi:MAG: glucose sorbosone dehydrogenase [Chloroflexi bacterium]|nr:glucose sorbosone dehydrogenase [Chloroflexota bacterium]
MLRPRSKNLAFLLLPVLALLALACGGDSASEDVTPEATNPPPAAAQLSLERVFSGLKFSRLTNLAEAEGRFFVTEQTGRIMSFPNDTETTEATVFLDIQARVHDSGNEEGLLGLAFDPRYSSNGHFYVHYSSDSPRRSVVSRFKVEEAGDPRADAGSELVIMEIPQPYKNHNGGQLAFGPDGMLYISLGDGGLGGDPQGNGQDRGTLLGSILRIDVSQASPQEPYRVPEDNPFAGVSGAREEIWAYGFRNPWRFPFDRQSGHLWVGDVGQNSFEEIDLVAKGGNYGWNILEGNHCFQPKTDCDPSETEPPVVEYGSDRGCSVIGGYVYRGRAIPSLIGTYLYGDFCSGEIRGLNYHDGETIGDFLLAETWFRITSFGVDATGEIYVLSEDGAIYLLVPVASNLQSA